MTKQYNTAQYYSNWQQQIIYRNAFILNKSTMSNLFIYFHKHYILFSFIGKYNLLNM